MICTEAACDRKVYAKGLCQKHHTAAWNAANPERRRELDRIRYRRDRDKRLAAANQASRERYRNNPDLHRDYQLKRKYGLSLDDYKQMAGGQLGRCAICGERPERLVVDHCHATGRIRSLLCGRCNSAIGFLKEDPVRVGRLHTYLIAYGR